MKIVSVNQMENGIVVNFQDGLALFLTPLFFTGRQISAS